MFLLLGLGAYFGYTRGNLAGGQQAKGRWVYDRSLGGKKVRGYGAATKFALLEEQLPADTMRLGVVQGVGIMWRLLFIAQHFLD